MRHTIYNFINALKASCHNLTLILLAFLAPITPLLITVGVFIVADTLMGIYRSRKRNESITSRKLSQIVNKFIIYQSAVILFFILEEFIIGDFVLIFTSIKYFLVKLMAALLCGIELMSINESYTLIYGYSLWEKCKKLITRAKYIKDEYKKIVDED